MVLNNNSIYFNKQELGIIFKKKKEVNYYVRLDFIEVM